MITYKNEHEVALLRRRYNTNSLSGTPKESMVINPDIAYHITDVDIMKCIPLEELRKNQAVFGKLSRMSQYDPVSNLEWDYLYFNDPSVFRPAAKAFEKSRESTRGTSLKPAYNRHLRNTKAWRDHWEEEANRIINGYEPVVKGRKCGLRISGEFYFYLNYCWIQKVLLDGKGEVIKDESGFPDFLSMDYYFFRELEARENPKQYGFPSSFKKSMSVTKSRRKGFSYKAASGAVWKTAFKTRAKVVIASAQGRDAALCFEKCLTIIDHISKYTPFGRKDPGRPSENGGWKHITMSHTKDSGHFRFGLVNTRTGEKEGRQSEIITASLFNKPDAASGEGLSRLYFEESGKISNLGDAWIFSLESLRVGSVYRSGIAVLFGTGGSMMQASGKKGSSRDFSLIHNAPESSGCAAYTNIYDYKPTENKCGYFVSDMWYNPGSKVTVGGKTYLGLDNKGNAFFWVAEIALNMERALKRPPRGDKKKYEKFLTQRCKTPSEAFLIMEGSVFQTEDLVARQNEILLSKAGFENLRMPGELVEQRGILDFIPKPNLVPITTMAVSNSEKEGCLVRYEPPIRMKGKIPDGAYMIAVDPIGLNTSTGKSLSSVIVFKTSKYVSWMGEEKIVATYYGRKAVNPQKYVHRLLMKLSKYYNAKITFENDRDGGIEQYFLRKGELDRLMSFPTSTVEKYIAGSKTRFRRFGHSMASSRHKQIGEDLLYEWLDKRGAKSVHLDMESGETVITDSVRNLDRLEDALLIEQLILYDRVGNYDAVMAMMGVVVQMKEWFDEELQEVEEDDSISSQLNEWYHDNYGSSYDKYQYKKDKNLI